MLIADTDYDVETEERIAPQLSRQSRGIVLCSPRMSDDAIRSLAASVPVVVANRPVEGVPSIVVDSDAALETVVDDLAELGHRRLAYLPGPATSWADRRRAEAITTHAQRHAIAVTHLAPTAARFEDGFAAREAVVASRVTAVIAFDDVLASGLVSGLLDRGVDVPRDVSVIGHDDVVASLAFPGLTTIAAHGDRIGSDAVDLLLVDPDDLPDASVRTIAPTIVRRRSVARSRER